MKTENINIGDFTELVAIKSPSSEKNSFGQPIATYSVYRSAWFQVNAASLGEASIAERIQYGETYDFIGHYDSNINTRYRLVYAGENYNILKIEILNDKLFMKITAIKDTD